MNTTTEAAKLNQAITQLRNVRIDEGIATVKTLEAGMMALRRIPRPTRAARTAMSAANDALAAAYEIELNNLARIGGAA